MRYLIIVSMLFLVACETSEDRKSHARKIISRTEFVESKGACWAVYSSASGHGMALSVVPDKFCKESDNVE